MTVQTENARVTFQGDGQSVSFPFGFRILEGDHIDVFLTNTTGSTVDGINPGQVRKLQPSEFSVNINDPQPGMGDPGIQGTPGGTVSLSAFGAPSTGIKISIERVTPLTQLTDYVPNDPFPANTHERALDKLTVIVQELNRELGDVLIKAPPGEDPNCPPLPIASERANSILGFNSNGCPTTLDINNFDITVPMVLSDLDNVAASNADNRQVISLNSTTGDWTPEDNVFSLNDLHGDITISTNSNGDIVIEDGDGNTDTIDTTEVRGSKLLSKFTAAESGVRGDFVAIRTNEQIELLKNVITSGGPAQTTDIVGSDGFAADSVYIPGTDKTVLLYRDSADDTIVRVRIVEIDPIAQEISQIGSSQTIVSFSVSWDTNAASIDYDTVNERLLIFVADPDNTNQPSVIAAEPDFANLAIAATGSLTAASTASEVENGDIAAIGFHEGEKTFVIGYQETSDVVNTNFHGGVLFAAQVDPSDNSVSVGTQVADPFSQGNVTFYNRFGYSPTNGVLVAFATTGAAADVNIFAINVSGTSISFGNVEELFDGGNGDIKFVSGLWAENLELGWIVYGEDFDNDGAFNLRAAVFSLAGDVLTVEDERILTTFSDVKPLPDPNQASPAYDEANNRWIVGSPDSGAAQAGDSDAAILTGTIDPSTPKLIFLEGGNASGTTSISTVDGDVNTNTIAPLVFDANSGLAVMFYRDDTIDSINVSLGKPPTSSSNRNRWIGNADVDFSAGDEVPVAMRGSNTFVNVGSNLTPGDIYFLDPDGNVGTSGGDFRAGIATAPDHMLTAGVDFRADGGDDTGGTVGGSTEFETVETKEITSATSQIDIALPSGFTRFRIELSEVQGDESDTSNDNMIVRFSNDGGSSFITTADYDWVSGGPTANGGFNSNNQDDDKVRLSPPASNSPAGTHNDYTLHIYGARNSNTFTNLRTEEISFEGGGQGIVQTFGSLKIAETHDAVRFSLQNGVSIARAVVRVSGAK